MQKERSAGHSFNYCIKIRYTEAQDGISVFIVNKKMWRECEARQTVLSEGVEQSSISSDFDRFSLKSSD